MWLSPHKGFVCCYMSLLCWRETWHGCTISLGQYLCLKVLLFLAMSHHRPASSSVLTVHAFSRRLPPVISVLAGGSTVSDGSSLAYHILPLQLRICFRFHALIAFHSCKSTHQSGTNLKEANSSFLWLILWYQPQPLISDQPFVTHISVFHIKTKACEGSIQGTLLSLPTCWPFFVLVLVMGRLSRKRRHGFFYFALPTFVILSIIISTAWAEAPVAWNLHHIDSCAKP